MEWNIRDQALSRLFLSFTLFALSFVIASPNDQGEPAFDLAAVVMNRHRGRTAVRMAEARSDRNLHVVGHGRIAPRPDDDFCAVRSGRNRHPARQFLTDRPPVRVTSH